MFHDELQVRAAQDRVAEQRAPQREVLGHELLALRRVAQRDGHGNQRDGHGNPPECGGLNQVDFEIEADELGKEMEEQAQAQVQLGEDSLMFSAR